MNGCFPQYYWPVPLYVATGIPLFDALYARWVARMGTPLLYNTEADDEAVFPYGTFTLVGNTPDWTFSEDFEDCFIQFNLFSETTTCEEASDLFEALKSAFDKFDLVVDGHETISLVRGVANLVRVDKKWQYIVNYELNIQKD